MLVKNNIENISPSFISHNTKTKYNKEDELKVLSELDSIVYSYLPMEHKEYLGLNMIGFSTLPKLIKEILIVKQWSEHHDWEGMLLNKNLTNEFVNVLENRFALTTLANKVKYLMYFVDDFYYENPIGNIQESIEEHNNLLANQEYVKTMTSIERLKPILLNKAFLLWSDNSLEINKLLEGLKYRTFQSQGS